MKPSCQLLDTNKYENRISFIKLMVISNKIGNIMVAETLSKRGMLLWKLS